MSTKRENREIEDRSAEIRRLEERLAELRPKYNMMYRDPLNFDENEIPYGWEYHWFRSTIYDVPDRSRMVEAQQRGWTIVPPERHPDRCFADYDGTIQKVISHKGLVCMERPKEIGDAERKKQSEYNKVRESSMPGLHNVLGEAPGAIPLKSYVNEVNWGPEPPASFGY
jgi:hypothetical protein